ncbi:MAG: aminoglycoside phosphotransferase family protein [Acidimicrobiales bacterium]
MHEDQIDSDVDLVRSLLEAQLPEWGVLPIEEVESTGTDNALYRLGSEMVVRMPLRPSATRSIDKEHRWLPILAPHLPLEIPVPIARGEPTREFPWPWSVLTWIEGEDATKAQFTGEQAASDLARFIAALQAIDPTGGPEPKNSNLGRGVPLAERDAFTRWAISASLGLVETDAVTAHWEEALKVPTWSQPSVWVHGDIAAGNILFRDGQLSAVIDWGALGIGDPACDLIIAWEIFDAGSRDVLRSELGVDDATWARSRGWALSTAIAELSYYQHTNPFMAARARRQLAAALNG